MSSQKGFRKYIFVSISLLFTFFVFQRFFLLAIDLPFFSDELHNLLASINFLVNGVYGFGIGNPEFSYEKNPSTGIIATFFPGLIYLFTGKLFWARFGLFLFSFTLFVILILAAFKKIDQKRSVHFGVRIIFAQALFLFFISVVPYLKATSTHILGEWPAAIAVAISLLTLASYPVLGLFLAGFTVIHIKLIYLPYFLCACLYYFVSNKISFYEFGKKITIAVAALVFPVLTMFAVIFILKGPPGLENYLTKQKTFRLSLFVGFSTQKAETKQEADLYASKSFIEQAKSRFQDPKLEWSTYQTLDKVRILFLGLMPPLVLLVSFFWSKKNGTLIFRDGFFLIGLASVQIAFFLWYFLIHNEMWIRHYQPALLAGTGILTYSIYSWLAQQSDPALPKTLLAQDSASCF
jgi:hypothetical protein